MILWYCDDWLSWKGLFPMVCSEWSWKGLFLMADLSGALLDLCVDLPAISGLLKVTFLFVVMVSTVAGVDASLGTLNSMMPNLSEAG